MSSDQTPDTANDPGKALGIAAFIASLTTFAGLPFLGPIAGIIMGGMARKRSREHGNGDNKYGRWGVTLGIIFLIVNVVLLIAVIVIWIVSFAHDPYGAPGPNTPPAGE